MNKEKALKNQGLEFREDMILLGGQNGNMIDKYVNSYLRKCLTDKDHRGIN